MATQDLTGGRFLLSKTGRKHRNRPALIPCWTSCRNHGDSNGFSGLWGRIEKGTELQYGKISGSLPIPLSILFYILLCVHFTLRSYQIHKFQLTPTVLQDYLWKGWHLCACIVLIFLFLETSSFLDIVLLLLTDISNVQVLGTFNPLRISHFRVDYCGILFPCCSSTIFSRSRRKLPQAWLIFAWTSH
jgi:hypothetical protein